MLVIAGNSLRRLIRVRSNLFFVFALPLLLILVLGLTVGTATPSIGVYAEGETTDSVEALIDELKAVDGVVTVAEHDEVVGEGLDEVVDAGPQRVAGKAMVNTMATQGE